MSINIQQLEGIIQMSAPSRIPQSHGGTNVITTAITYVQFHRKQSDAANVTRG